MIHRSPSSTNAAGRLWKILGLSWLSMIGVDFLLHGGLLAKLYRDPHPFLLSPHEAFTRIPLGYLSFLLLAILLIRVLRDRDVRDGWHGASIGASLGALLWGSVALGLYSISTAPLSLLAGWFAGQSAELAVAGAIAGAGLSGAPLRPLLFKTIAVVLGALVATVVLQTLGLAPAMKV